VQTIIPLPGKGAMRLTTARYYTPSGRSIQATGIEPDITVERTLLEAVEDSDQGRESDLRGALDAPADGDAEPTDEGASGDVDVEAEPDTDAEAPPTEARLDIDGGLIDFQLQRALDLLKGVALFDKKA